MTQAELAEWLAEELSKLRDFLGEERRDREALRDRVDVCCDRLDAVRDQMDVSRKRCDVCSGRLDALERGWTPGAFFTLEQVKEMLDETAATVLEDPQAPSTNTVIAPSMQAMLDTAGNQVLDKLVNKQRADDILHRIFRAALSEERRSREQLQDKFDTFTGCFAQEYPGVLTKSIAVVEKIMMEKLDQANSERIHELSNTMKTKLADSIEKFALQNKAMFNETASDLHTALKTWWGHAFDHQATTHRTELAAARASTDKATAILTDLTAQLDSLSTMVGKMSHRLGEAERARAANSIVCETLQKALDERKAYAEKLRAKFMRLRRRVWWAFQLHGLPWFQEEGVRPVLPSFVVVEDEEFQPDWGGMMDSAEEEEEEERT